MESRLHHDFARVRVHADGDVGLAGSAQALGASAYTLGPDVVFAPGYYSPQTPAGRKLLAHELAHVIQQGGPAAQTSPDEVGAEVGEEVLEAQAEAVAERGADQDGHVPAAALARTGPHLQRSPLPKFSGTRLAQLTSPDRAGDIVAGQELVPPTEDAGSFTGFPGELEAVVTGHRHPSASVVVQDSEERYHTFAAQTAGSDLEPLDPDREQFTVAPYTTAGRGYNFVRWVNLIRATPEEPVRSWEERVKEAHDLNAKYKSEKNEAARTAARTKAENAFAELVVDALGVKREEVHIARGKDRLPGVVNFDLDLTEATGEGGIAKLPSTRTGDVPAPTLTLGPFAFRSQSEVLAQRTFFHEAAHVAHSERAIALLDQWRRSKSKDDFRTWLRDQRDRKRITSSDYDLTIERLEGGLPSTQTLAVLEGFVESYQLLPTTTDKGVLFDQLGKMAQEWPTAGWEVGERAVERLWKYYCTVMDDDHRRAFDQFVAEQLERAEKAEETSRDRDLAYLYRKLVLFASKKCK
jgi:hypothetical protein